MQKHVQKRLIKCGGSCSEPGHSRVWHNPPALSGLLRSVFRLSSFGSREKNVCAKCNCVGVFSHTIRLPDASCWASVLYRGTSDKDSIIASPLFWGKTLQALSKNFKDKSLMERKTSVAIQAAHIISSIFTELEIRWRTYFVRCYRSLVFLRISNNFPNMRLNQSDLIKLKSWSEVLNVYLNDAHPSKLKQQVLDICGIPGDWAT